MVAIAAGSLHSFSSVSGSSLPSVSLGASSPSSPFLLSLPDPSRADPSVPALGVHPLLPLKSPFPSFSDCDCQNGLRFSRKSLPLFPLPVVDVCLPRRSLALFHLFPTFDSRVRERGRYREASCAYTIPLPIFRPLLANVSSFGRRRKKIVSRPCFLPLRGRSPLDTPETGFSVFFHCSRTRGGALFLSDFEGPSPSRSCFSCPFFRFRPVRFSIPGGV